MFVFPLPLEVPWTRSPPSQERSIREVDQNQEEVEFVMAKYETAFVIGNEQSSSPACIYLQCGSTRERQFTHSPKYSINVDFSQLADFHQF